MSKFVTIEEEPEINYRKDQFKIDTNHLNDLFEPANIKEGLSMDKIAKLEGVSGVVALLKSDIKSGLSSQNATDLHDRALIFGKNDPIIKPRKTLWKMIAEALEDLMLRIIAAAAIVSLAVGILKDGIETGWIEGVTILIALVIIVLVTAGNNYVKELQFEKLYRKTEERTVEVVRDGKHQQLNIFALLVGDIMNVQIGEILPVDGLFVSGSELLMDESAITGESDLCRKQLPESQGKVSERATPFLLSGSKCMDGSAQMLVCTVGVNTLNGKLKLKLQGEAPPTPLQVKLESVASDIGKAGVVVAALTVAALFIHYFSKLTRYETCFLCYDTLQFLISALLQGVIIIVVAVPEGLPLAVTISLSYSVNKMKDENNLVRQLQSCEIMGGANSICSDKTGTLTQNKMSVTNMYFEGKELTSENFSSAGFNKENVAILCECVCVNSTANPEKKADGTWEQIGNKTECALLELADILGSHYKSFRPSEKIIRVIPFSSSRKKMTTIYKRGENQYRIYIKGASENVLEKCTSYLTHRGTERLDKPLFESISDNVINTFANQSLRTIGIAYKEVNANPSAWTDDDIEKDLTLVSVTGIKDPLRPEINDAIRKCKYAGINVRMVTGDNIATAVSISKECGILPKSFELKEGGYEALDGKRFRDLVGGVVFDDQKTGTGGRVRSFEEFKKIVKVLKVLARSTPDDKYTLVTGLIQMGEVVAVTGDGTNDAPALKKADVGFAMGIAGTEVAKEAAGIILLDDNFRSIVTACKWGRNIYDSIRKFIQFQLTINLVALFIAFIGAVFISSSPLSSIQMLWINLIQDTFAALALATEPPSEDVLNRRPYSRHEYIVTPMMWRNMIGQSLYQNLVFTVMLFLGPEIFGIPDSTEMVEWSPEKGVHFTLIFHAFVFAQVFNQINCRKLLRTDNIFKNFCNNSLFFVVEIGTLIVQFLLVELGGTFTKCSPLTIPQHLYCIAIGAGTILVGYLIRALPDKLFEKVPYLKEEEEPAQDHSSI